MQKAHPYAEGLMSCERCQGLMVVAYLIEEGEIIPCWHCLNCGNYLDKTIRRNHQLCRPPARSRARTPAFVSEPSLRLTSALEEWFSLFGEPSFEEPSLPRPDLVEF
jgi:hypothetical protein